MDLKNKMIIVSSFVITLVVAVVLTIVFASNNKKITVYKNDELNTYISITYSEFEEKIQQKESFVIYLSNSVCGGCAVFEPILIDYIQTNKVPIYETPLSSHDFPAEYTPSIVIYKNGEFLTLIDPIKESTVFENTSLLKKTLSKYIKIK